MDSKSPSRFEAAQQAAPHPAGPARVAELVSAFIRVYDSAI